MTTEEIFRTDAYARSIEASVVAIDGDGSIILNRTVFYPNGGGQPGDRGWVDTADGQRIAITDTRYGADRAIVHVPENAGGLDTGMDVTATIDWEVRHPRMRMHTALHLLSAVLPYPVTGGQLTETSGRLDFDIPDAGLDKAEIGEAVNRIASAGHAVSLEWITDAELDAQPELVKTLSVQPPRGSGRIRLIRIGDVDLQPCGGTHVANTSEIGPVIVSKIEKKGARNRRVRVAFAT